MDLVPTELIHIGFTWYRCGASGLLPFSRNAGGVASLLEQVSKRDVRCMQGLRLHEIALIVHACHKRHASRLTNRVSKCVASQDTFIGQSIDCWGGHWYAFEQARGRI